MYSKYKTIITPNGNFRSLRKHTYCKVIVFVLNTIDPVSAALSRPKIVVQVESTKLYVWY